MKIGTMMRRGALAALAVAAVAGPAFAQKTKLAVYTALENDQLDPFKRVVHIVPVWSSDINGYIETVWPGIAEHRTTAFRTKQYAGADAAQFGEIREQSFEGTTRSAVVRYPEWCQLTVYRLINGQRVPVPGPRVYWLETYSAIGRTRVPKSEHAVNDGRVLCCECLCLCDD